MSYSIKLLTCFLVAGLTPLALAAQAQQTAPAEPSVQLQKPTGAAQPPITITLADAIARARKVDAQYLSAQGDARNAHDDTLEARNAMLPQVSASSQFLGTQGNGGRTEVGRFVTNDGVHVYRAWGVFKQDLSPTTYLGTGYRQAQAAEALAKAKAEIAQRGLTVTVTKIYYSLAEAQRNYSVEQAALDQAQHFL
ncbi:MAG TPA: TolC family protein, partial [Candidatus Acidoferrales bacterium]